MMKTYWFAAHDQFGNQFGGTVEAENSDEAIEKFENAYPDCDIVDYDSYDYDDYEDFKCSDYNQGLKFKASIGV